MAPGLVLRLFVRVGRSTAPATVELEGAPSLEPAWSGVRSFCASGCGRSRVLDAQSREVDVGSAR